MGIGGGGGGRREGENFSPDHLAILLVNEGIEIAPQEFLGGSSKVANVGFVNEGQSSVWLPAGDEFRLVPDNGAKQCFTFACRFFCLFPGGVVEEGADDALQRAIRIEDGGTADEDIKFATVLADEFDFIAGGDTCAPPGKFAVYKGKVFG